METTRKFIIAIINVRGVPTKLYFNRNIVIKQHFVGRLSCQGSQTIEWTFNLLEIFKKIRNRQKYYQILKEHPKLSKIAEFC